MKKKILLIILVVCLVIGGIGGVIYAGGHGSLHGQKLVGSAYYGHANEEDRGVKEMIPYFRFTNPDCKNEITIKGVYIIHPNGDAQEILVEELGVNGDSTATATSKMSPHQTYFIWLEAYLPPALDTPHAFYTVEIFWEAEKDAAELIGWQAVWYRVGGFEGDDPCSFREMTLESPMVNVKQK